MPGPPESSKPTDSIVTGGCLCGAVRYEIDGMPLFMAHCHCSNCRKFSGAARSTNVGVPREQFRITAGAELLGVYRHEGRKDLVFCSRCGASLLAINRWPDGAIVRVRMGCMDGDPGIRPMVQAFVASKAPWCAITDQVPQFPETVG